MKQIKRSLIILGMVSIAIVIKAIQEANVVMGLVAFLLMMLLFSRILLLKKVMQEDMNMQYENTDFMHVHLQKRDAYKEMYEVYKAGNCVILYEENDGILFYDHTSKKYYASALKIEGAKDIARLIPQDYDDFIVFDTIFEGIENIEFKYSEKIKDENKITYKK